MNELTANGSLAGGGDRGDIGLIYVPEPSGAVLGVCGAITRRRWSAGDSPADHSD